MAYKIVNFYIPVAALAAQTGPPNSAIHAAKAAGPASTCFGRETQMTQATVTQTIT